MAEVTAAGRQRHPTLRKTSFVTQEYIILMLALLLVVAFSISLPGFATVGNFFTLMRSVSVLGILGLAMALVVIGRGLDLSLIATMAAGTATVMQAMNAGYSFPVALLIGLAVALAIGLVNGWIIAFVEVPALFTTLATSFLIFGLARFAFKTVIVYPPQTADLFLYLGQGRPLGIPMPIVMFAFIAFIVHLFMSRTSLGRFIYARGDNPEAARLTGIDVRRDIIVSYMVAALIGFLAGLVSGASTVSMNMQIINSTLIFDVVLVVVLGGVSLVGGRGSVLSVIAGTALIGVLLNGLTIMNVNNQIQDVIRGLVLLGAIILDNRLHPRDEETARQGD